MPFWSWVRNYSKKVKQILERQGYDSIIQKEDHPSATGKPSAIAYIVFDPSQIKWSFNKEAKKVELVKTPGFVIEVPREQRKTFFVPAKTPLVYWAFKNRPRVFVKEKLIFTFDKKPVAEAIVLKIENPGHGEGEHKSWYKVFWKPSTFKKFKGVTAASKWLYHVTFARNLEGIAERGLIPYSGGGITGGGDPDKVFASEAEHVSYWLSKAEQWAYDRSDNLAEDGWVPVVIRFPRTDVEAIENDEIAVKEDTGEGSYKATTVIPDHMQAWNGKAWVGLYDVDPHALVDKEGYILAQEPKLAAAKKKRPLTKELLMRIAWQAREAICPDGCDGQCQEVSDWIVEKLEKMGYPEAYTAFGQFRGEMRHAHSWVVVDQWEVDATQDQFASYFDDEEDLLDNPVYVGPRREWGHTKSADYHDEQGYWVGEGGGASGILPVCPSKGTVCLAWRSQYVQTPDCWGTIGGAVQKGKSPQESAKAELQEETGYSGGITLIPAYTFTDGSFSYRNYIGVCATEFPLAPKPFPKEHIEELQKKLPEELWYQLEPGWETDHIQWVKYETVLDDMNENPEDYHPGMIKLFKNSKDIIERALNIKTAAVKDPALDAFMRDLWAQTTGNPFNNRERVWQNKAIIEARPFGGEIHLSFIRSVEQNKGWGTEGLKFLIGLADKHGVSIDLDASPVGEKVLSKSQLIAWYKRHGFEHVKGDEADHLQYTPKRLKLGPNMKSVPMDKDKKAWHEIEYADKNDEGEMEGDLLGGILESDADIKAWAGNEDIDDDPKLLAKYMKLFKGKRVAVIDSINAWNPGHGKGTELLSRFITEAKAKNCDAIVLEVGNAQNDFNLYNWYKKYGFREFGKTIGDKLPIMVKWLKPAKTAAPDLMAMRKPCPSGKRKFFDQVSAIGPHKQWDKGTPNLRAYECPLCSFWHLTSKPKWSAEGVEQQHMFPSSQDAKFRQWFDGSKVVDKNGNPMPVYHGTRSSVDFEEFAVDGPPYVEGDYGESETTSSGSGADPTAFLGAHFAEEYNVANQFAVGQGWQKSRYEGEAPKPRVIQVFLRITNPKDFGSEHNLREFINQGKITDDDALSILCRTETEFEPWEDVDGEAQQKIEEFFAKYENDQAYRSEQNRFLLEDYRPLDMEDDTLRNAAYELAMQARHRLEQAGHDGIRYKNVVEGGHAWVAFNPNQIKSVYSQFNPKDPRFTASKEADWKSKYVLPTALALGLGAPSTSPNELTPKETAPIVEPLEKRVSLDELVEAIRRTEGADPDLHNPGNLVGFHSGQIMSFPTEEQGVHALKNALNRIADGKNPAFTPDMTLEEAGKVYSNGDPNWAKNVAQILGVSIQTPFAKLIKGMAKVGSSDWFKKAAGFAFKSFPKLWHVGTMKAKHKGEGSLEGAGLSVSIHPEEWKDIAEIGGPTWELTKPGNKFLNFHRLSKPQREQIVQWGIKNGYVTEMSVVWRLEYYDSEADEERYMEYPTKEEAEAELGSGYGDNEKVVPVKSKSGKRSISGTDKLKQRTKNPRADDTVVAFDLLVTVYAEDELDCDGVWWQDTFDPASLSAPRGVIFASRLPSWKAKKVANAAAKKPSETQLAALQRMAAGDGTIHREKGGFWITGDIIIGWDTMGLPKFKGEEEGYLNPRPWVDVRTVRAMETRGWVERTNTFPEEWRDVRRITDAGRALLQGKTAATEWEQFGEEYAEGLKKLNSDPWVEFVPVSELLPLREYEWDQNYNRHGSDKFTELVEDMKKYGVREPITIRYFPDTKRAVIIEGNHRVAAAMAAGLKEVPARVTIASYPQKDYGHSSRGGAVKGRNTTERPYSDFIKPSDIGLSGKKTKTASSWKRLPATDEWINRAKLFLKDKWAERHKELGREGIPGDLKGACKFASLFAQKLFGGKMVGSAEHQMLKLPSRMLDLTDIYDPNTFQHDKDFWENNPEHEESMKSCEPRVQQWVDEFMEMWWQEAYMKGEKPA